MIQALVLTLLALSAGWTVAGLAAVAWVHRLRPRPPRGTAPVTVLKPLAGADPGLEANLGSFFRQDHPRFQIVLGVERADDPAVAVARRVMARHPRVDARLVVHATAGAKNPKVRNLLGMWGHAAHDLVLVSDSNVRVEQGHLAELVGAIEGRPEVGVVTSPIVGVGEGSLGGALEAVQTCGFVAAGATLPTLLGDAVVIGKSMLFRRSVLERLGGLARVKDLLAEDHVLGKTFEHAGYRVLVARAAVAHVIGAPSLRAVLDRHVRWGLLRSRLRPLAHLGEIVTAPLALVPALCLAMELPEALACALSIAWIRDVGGWLVLRGPGALHLPLLLAPARDLFALVVWAIAPLRRHVAWRGHRVRVGAGTLLYEVRERVPRGVEGVPAGA